MAANTGAIIDTTEHTCTNCNAIVFKWIDMQTGEEYWATDMCRATCIGDINNFHSVLE